MTLWKTHKFDGSHVLNGRPLTIRYWAKPNWFWYFWSKLWRKR